MRGETMSCWSWFLLYIFPIYGLISCDRQNCDILTEILSNGVTSHVYSGAVAMVGNEKGLLYSQAVGYYSYDTNDKPVNIFSSIFDIASLTKVISTTSAVAHLYQAGLLSPDDYVVNILGENYGQHNKHLIQIKHCLLHNAGYSPDPIPWYWDQEFPCPNTDDEYPAEDFSCIYPFIYNSFINETLNTLPGEAYVYSDLSFLTLQYVVGMIVLKNHLISRNDYRDECIQWIDAHNIVEILSPLDLICAYEAYVRREVFGYHFIDILPHTTTTTTSGNSHELKRMESTSFLPLSEIWSSILPTLNDTGPDSYTHKRLQGQVADGDCYAMGGLCGHAGVFSTAYDISLLLHGYLRQIFHPTSNSFFLNSSTIDLFTKIKNISQSSRAYGWTINTPVIADYGYDNSCGEMSNQTFMHTGYTGTCCCVDPSLQSPMWTVILTNRIYNCDGQLCPSGSSDAVKAIYREFNTQAKRIFYP